MNNEGKDATLSREQVERYYAEVTSPDELGVTDPRMKAVFDMALRYRDVLDAEVVGVVGKSYEGVYKLPIGTKLIAAPGGEK
jgi:hypothetical protein